MISKNTLLKDGRLYLIVNVNPAQKPSSAKLINLIRSGIDIVQLRCKDISDGIFLRYAFLLRRICSACHAVFIINDRPDIAKICGADGVHLGQDDMPALYARMIIGKGRILGLSTHNLTQIKKAEVLRCIDYIGVGPLFKTEIKPHAEPIGLNLIRRISAERIPLTYFAIGGINLGNIDSVIKAGAKRIAVSNSIFNSRHPLRTIKSFRKVLYDAD